MNIPYGIFNVTLQKWVKDEDGKDYVAHDYFDAKETMATVQMFSNASFTDKFKNNEFEIREKTMFI